MEGESNMQIPDITIKGGRISIGETETPESIYTPDEQSAFSIILDALKESGVDPQTIHTERTKEYINIVAHVQHSDFLHKPAFCRLKLSGRVNYIELTINSNDAKQLKNDPRFESVDLGKKRFSRILISTVYDISKYKDIIFPAYKWGIAAA